MSILLVRPRPLSPFARWLRDRRCEKRLSVRQLAMLIGLSPAQVGDVLRGKEPVLPVSTWKQVAYHLDVPLWLVAQLADASVDPLWN